MSKIEELANEMFGEMRNLTKEESEMLYKYLQEISEPTGVDLFDKKTWVNSVKLFNTEGE